MADSVRVVLDHRAIDRFLAEPWLVDALLDASGPTVRGAQRDAPKATGQGAESIHAEAVLDTGAWEAWIGWTRERYYMSFSELGTQFMDARPFLVPNLRS